MGRQSTKHLEIRYSLRSSTYQNATLPNSRYRYEQKDQNSVLLGKEMCFTLNLTSINLLDTRTEEDFVELNMMKV